MNVLLVALVSELVDCCNRSCEQFISSKEAQNIIFYDRYNRIFTQFEYFVRGVRSGRSRKDDEITPATIIQKHIVDEESSIFIEIGSDYRSSSSNKENNSNQNVKETNKKSFKEKSTNRRRRRRWPMSNNSNTDSESDAHNSDLK